MSFLSFLLLFFLFYMFPFFFFYLYCDPRDLHSFPTRRSSDLCSAFRLPCCSPSESSWRGTTSCSCSSAPASPMQDRKSTRLNSSHGYISYAVFCLKKKKKKQY